MVKIPKRLLYGNVVDIRRQGRPEKEVAVGYGARFEKDVDRCKEKTMK